MQSTVGICLVLLSALALSAQNVVLRLFFNPGVLWGHWVFGGFVPPQLSNIVLLLALRMGVMALLLAGLSPWLYSGTFGALRKLPAQRSLLGYVIASGGCLFLGLTLLYVALSQIAVGVAIATFFIYPAITLLLAWYWLQQRPQQFQLGLMVVIFVGVILTTVVPGATTANNAVLGSLSALGAGLSFGLYGIVAERSLQPKLSQPALHPVPFSLCTFSLVALFASVLLAVVQPVTIDLADRGPLLLMTILSATLALISYVLSNFGIRYIGASLTALASASTPALTTLFAGWALQEALLDQQLAGIGLITAGVALLSVKTRAVR